MIDWRTRLRQKLRESGKSNLHVCKEAGLNPAYLTQILEAKAATPRIDNLAKIAAVLNTSVSYIAEGVDLDATGSKIVGLFHALDANRREAAMVSLRAMAEASQLDRQAPAGQ